MSGPSNSPRKGLARKLVYESDNYSMLSSWQDYLYLANYSDGTFGFFAKKYCADWGDESPLKACLVDIKSPAQFVRTFRKISQWLETEDLTIRDCFRTLKKMDRGFFEGVLSELVQEGWMGEEEKEKLLNR